MSLALAKIPRWPMPMRQLTAPVPLHTPQSVPFVERLPHAHRLVQHTEDPTMGRVAVVALLQYQTNFVLSIASVHVILIVANQSCQMSKNP